MDRIGESMSVNNGRAWATSPDGAVQGPGDYIARLDDTAPIDVVDREPATENADMQAFARELATEVEAAETVVTLQQKPALLQAMDPKELDEQKALEALRRATDRKFQTWQIERSLRVRKSTVRRESWRTWLDRRSAAKDRSEGASDRRWQVRAKRRRIRLTSPDAKIATHIRSSTRWSVLLIALMISGMAYTGFTVQANFFPTAEPTDPQYWLSLFLEAMSSVSLMALMAYDVRRARVVDKRTGMAAFWGWTAKAVLLGFSVLAAAGPALRGGHFVDIVRTGWAPIVVAVVLLIHDLIARGDAEVLQKLYAAAEQDRVRELALLAEFAVQQGLLSPSMDNKEGESAPSATKIASFFKINKEVAGEVRAAVNVRSHGAAA
jgi:hypothetical protein